MKHLFWLMMCTIFIFVTACGSKQQADVKTKAREDVHKVDQAQEQVKEEWIKDLFLHKLESGMTENEVRALFGANFSLVKKATESIESWRYDLEAVEGYDFDDLGIDQVDMEGLKAGRIAQQLFIDWSADGTLSSASLYMYSAGQNGYYEYDLLPGGTREEIFYESN